MSLNDSMSDVERAKLAVWDYPVSDKYTKMWQSMQEAGLPANFQEALDRVRSSSSSSEGYAYLGKKNYRLFYHYYPLKNKGYLMLSYDICCIWNQKYK